MALLAGDVIVVEDVTFDTRDLNVLEARCREHLKRLLLPPRGTQTLTMGSERDGHAVHRGGAIKKGSQWVADVIVQMTRSGDVHTQEGAPGLQGVVDALEDACGV